jgi:VWFA-related protein
MIGQMKRCVAVFAGVLTALTASSPVVSAQTPRFRATTELVDVAVVVRDRDGRMVPDLTVADFQVTEDGMPQTIAAFGRVTYKPASAPAALPIATDVSTNENVTDGRIFVLLLDGLHVSPIGISHVRRYARQFVERHVGPHDLVAVLAPGAESAATQDFTSDKARLIAAIDRFSGTKLRSATLELDEERRLAANTGTPVHGGKDPSDEERADRARRLSSILQSLAAHLERVERRRKTLLLFSEGVDYNLDDLMGGVQRNASDVIRAMERAVAALMRTNVSLYTIDPRALSSGDMSTTEATPSQTAPNAPRADGTRPRLDFSEPSLDAEYAASIRSLRQLAEPTGGFAIVDQNDYRGAFDRIVSESSDYYIIGYSPSRPPKPGEFRRISVRVARPGVSVVARKGYTARVATTDSSVAADTSIDQPFSGSPRIGSRSAPSVTFPSTASAAAPKGLSASLAALLASPLPAAGLTMRVHATPFRGSGGKADVQLTIEVLGSALAFAENGGRHQERIELALLTVDERGRGENGRSTTIDLRLTAEELQRVRTTGVRWISHLDLSPGRYQVRVAGRSTGAGTDGLVTADVLVPRFDNTVSLSGVSLTSLPASLMITRGDARLAEVLQLPPTATRTFVRGDRIRAAVEVYVSSANRSLDIRARLERTDGSVVHEMTERATFAADARRGTAGFTIDTASLVPGVYLLRISGTQLDGSDRIVPFEITRPPTR